MSQQFTFPDPGEGLHEAEIVEVHVSSGDHVDDGDTVLTVETDKADTDVPAPFSGTVKEVRVQEGQMIEVGDVLLTYDQDGDSGQSQRKAAGGESQGAEEGREKPEKAPREQPSRPQSEESSQGSTEKGEPRRSASGRRPVPAAPSTRRVARELGVDLHDVEPSGDHGRVTTEDVEAAARAEPGQRKQARRGASGAAALTPGLEPSPLPDFSPWGEVERSPLRSIRRATAQNMARSWAEIPHVYHQDIADVTALERFRREQADRAEAGGGKFTLTVLVMKALVSVLKAFPRFNASLDVENQELVYKRYFHVGLAVATDRGLLVPVIRDVDRKSLVELSAEATDIARKARNGELKREDMQGGSITVTNPGPMGGSGLTPLINHPQVAIVGMGQARLEPVAYGDLDDHEIRTRLRLPLVLGFDHRVNDGADAARFVTTLMQTLDRPESLLLNI